MLDLLDNFSGEQNTCMFMKIFHMWIVMDLSKCFISPDSFPGNQSIRINEAAMYITNISHISKVSQLLQPAFYQSVGMSQCVCICVILSAHTKQDWIKWQINWCYVLLQAANSLQFIHNLVLIRLGSRHSPCRSSPVASSQSHYCSEWFKIRKDSLQCMALRSNAVFLSTKKVYHLEWFETLLLKQ
jgi:hypothetical protein